MRTVLVCLSLVVMSIPAVTSAQGFGVYEHGACAMSRANAAVAAPCEDGSAVYLNPAGIVGRKGLILSGGTTAIFGDTTFTSDAGISTTTDNPFANAPHAYFQYGVTERLGIGLGFYAPYGLRVRWPIEFEGRFVSYDSDLRTGYLQPTVAYRLNDFVSVGIGLTIAGSSVDLSRREDLATVPLGVVPGLTFGALVDGQTDFVDTSLSASGARGVGANLGVLLKPHDRLRIGIKYLTPVTLDYDGTADFTPIAANYTVTKPNPLGLPVGTPINAFVAQAQAALQDQAAMTGLEMPAQLVAGVNVRVSPRITLSGDYHWVGWSAFDTVTLDFTMPVPPDEHLYQDYRDTSAIRLGADFQAAPALRLSAGYAYNQAAAPDETVTPLLPEAERNHFTAGFGWSLSRRVTVDVAYQFIAHADRRGRVVNPPPGVLPTVVLNSGEYQTRADLFGITLTWHP